VFSEEKVRAAIQQFFEAVHSKDLKSLQKVVEYSLAKEIYYEL
jgi:hypothetical protein